MSLLDIAKSQLSSLAQKAKAVALKVSDVELKVLEATNHDSWGPHGQTMSGGRRAGRARRRWPGMQRAGWRDARVEARRGAPLGAGAPGADLPRPSRPAEIAQLAYDPQNYREIMVGARVPPAGCRSAASAPAAAPRAPAARAAPSPTCRRL
jgi:hypothetical protein